MTGAKHPYIDRMNVRGCSRWTDSDATCPVCRAYYESVVTPGCTSYLFQVSKIGRRPQMQPPACAVRATTTHEQHMYQAAREGLDYF